MTNSKVLFQGIMSQLTLDDPAETRAIALALMRHFYHFTLTDILSEKEVEFRDLSPLIERLNKQEPLHYTLGEADFYGRPFGVNPFVLIPRPETELLIQEVLKTKPEAPRILDVGTGSGCIAITLHLEIANSKVYALEVNQNALDTAKSNALKLGASLQFIQADFLGAEINLEPLDILVSNPPYITEFEKQFMKSNVLNFEPHQALFVTNEDPLLFYKAIALKGKSLLRSSGKVFVEINEKFGNEVKELFELSGYNPVKILKDLDGKDRIAVAQKDQ